MANRLSNSLDAYGGSINLKSATTYLLTCSVHFVIQEGAYLANMIRTSLLRIQATVQVLFVVL